MADDESSSAAFRLVEDWLRSMGLICYAQSFYDNGYENIDICKEIGEEDLNVLGVTNIKDRNDILAGVCRIKQKAVYFELESDEDVPSEPIIRKLDPFLLITRVKAELEKENVQLTEPPFFYPDGSLGSLDSLAEQLSFKFETYHEDVYNALDQLRRRQLPTGLYNDVNELMEMQKDQEKKKRFGSKAIGPPKPKREDREEPKAYLNVETPFRRTTSMSLSKHDKRITKSTTNLADVELDNQPLEVNHKKKHKKGKSVSKSFSTREKSKALFGLSIRKRSPTSGDKDKINKLNNRESFVAKDLTMNQKELKELMLKVKHGEISEDKVLDQVNLNYRQSVMMDSNFDHVKSLPKHQLTKKEKKQLEKEDKKRRKTERKKSNSTGHSTFYTSDGEHSGLHNPLTELIGEEGSTTEDLVQLGHSSGSDVSRESPDLRAALVENITHKMSGNGSATFVSQDSLNSSSGSLSSGAGSGIIYDPQEAAKKSRSNSVRSLTKPAKHPPPIPTRNDQLTDSSGLVSNANSKGPQLPFLSEQKNALKSTLSAPPSRTPPVAPPRDSSDATKRKGQIPSSKSMELPTGKNTATDKAKANEGPNNDPVFQVKAFPFAVKDLQREIKSKTEELNKRKSIVPKMEQNTDTEKSLTVQNQPSPKDPPIPKVKPVAQTRKTSNENKTETKTQTAKDVTSPDAKTTTINSVYDEKTENCQENVSHVTVTPATEKKHPVPPPRKPAKSFATEHDLKDVKPLQNENRPSVPPRKRRSGSYEIDVMNSQASTDDNVVPKVDVPTTRHSVPGAQKPVPKPKPPLPPRQSSELISIRESKAEQHPDAGTTEIRQVTTSGNSIESNSSAGVVVSGTAESVKRNIFTARPTRDLVRIKLSKEDVDLTEEPYTDVDGGWNVPFSLVERFVRELEQPIERVVRSIEELRCELLQRGSRPVKPVVVNDVIERRTNAVAYSSVREWLISVGLPMFVNDFLSCGNPSLGELQKVTREEILTVGVYEERHIEQLLDNLKKIKAC